MNEQFVARVEAALSRAGVLRADATLLVALSGGADSVALLHAVCALRGKWGLTVRAAHVEHGLRGETSLADAHFCAQLCRELQVPFTCDHAHLTGGMADRGAEARAREARYALLLTRARQCGATALLTAHHLDDQAETVLAHLIRGSGARGLGGMREVSRREGVTLVRPLLGVPKQALLNALGTLPYQNDESNAMLCCQRNRLRALVLPQLTAENPRAAEHIAQSAALLALDDDCLQAQADALLEAAWLNRPPLCCLQKLAVAQAPKAIALRVLRGFVERGLALRDGPAPVNRNAPYSGQPVTQANTQLYDTGEALSGDALPLLGRYAPAADEALSGDAKSQRGGYVPVAGEALSGDTKPLGGGYAPVVSEALSGDTKPLLGGYAPVAGEALSADDAMALHALLTAPVGTVLNLPHALCAVVGARHIHLTNMGGGRPLCPVPAPPAVMLDPLPAQVCFDGVTLRLRAFDPQRDVPPDGVRAVVVPTARLLRCTVRTAAAGDRIAPFGAGGGKLLRRYWVDHKVDLPFRPCVPLLCDSHDVLWVMGVGAAEGTRLSAEPATCVSVEGELPWAWRG